MQSLRTAYHHLLQNLCHVSCVLCLCRWMDGIDRMYTCTLYTHVCVRYDVATRTRTTKELQEFLLPIDPGNHPPHQPGSSSHIHSPTHAHKGLCS